MPRYHLKFKKSDYVEEVIQATELLFEAKPWQMDLGQESVFQAWSDVVCAVNVAPRATIVIDTNGRGYDYDYDLSIISVGRASLASLFVGMGHHLWTTINGQESNSPEISIAWGYSLFYSVKPVMFRRRVREGRILGMTAKDTFSSATWEQLVSLGQTDGDKLVNPALDIRTLETEDDLVNPQDSVEADDSAPLADVIRLVHRDGWSEGSVVINQP